MGATNLNIDSTFKVLIVDDEPEILDLLKYNFTKKGFHVAVAKNGEEGFEKAKAELPQVIVLDIMMPVMNGIQLCRSLKSDKAFKNIPVLFLSATNDDNLIINGITSGGDYFVSKPVRISSLIDIVFSLHEEFKLKNSDLYF
jgi:two-component system alkaline phosphatase synthesis response regulator PhoP